MSELLSTLMFGLMMVALVLGLSCIVMTFISTKSGKEALQERIEYGFLGVSCLVVALLMVYAML
ncbi:hypothetical protein [Glaciecola sp. SC05]|uniref:hypothetical protein n=1 Tax=Glaciecola sp. SC05 TaxID=1987355 RepID=UPI0035292187